MQERRRLILVAAALCAAVAALWLARSSLERARAPAAPAAAPSTASAAEDERVGAALEALGKASDAELEARLDAYLGAVKQVYGDQADAFLDEEHTPLVLPVPPMDALEREVLALPPGEAEQGD